jgi:tetratricopeptide (TPR) repeat protein
MLSKRSLVRLGVAASAVFVLLLMGVRYSSKQIQEAEAGRPYHLPNFVKKLVAAREYRAAKRSPYKDHQLQGYLTAVALDPDGFPDAWSYLCTFHSGYEQWTAARTACEQSLRLNGPTIENQKALGRLYAASKDYFAAAEAYANASHLSPTEPRLSEQALWMFLAAHRYEKAAEVAQDLIAHPDFDDAQVNNAKAHIVLGFANAQLGKGDAAQSAYEMGFPGLREISCAQEDRPGGIALLCSGLSKAGKRNSSCIGGGCR